MKIEYFFFFTFQNEVNFNCFINVMSNIRYMAEIIFEASNERVLINMTRGTMTNHPLKLTRTTKTESIFRSHVNIHETTNQR